MGPSHARQRTSTRSRKPPDPLLHGGVAPRGRHGWRRGRVLRHGQIGVQVVAPEQVESFRSYPLPHQRKPLDRQTEPAACRSAKTREAARRVAANAPPLTPEQRARLVGSRPGAADEPGEHDDALGAPDDGGGPHPLDGLLEVADVLGL